MIIIINSDTFSRIHAVSGKDRNISILLQVSCK